MGDIQAGERAWKSGVSESRWADPLLNLNKKLASKLN